MRMLKCWPNSVQQMPHLELVLIGIGSCIVFDVWQRIFQIFTSIPPSNWTLVGRWFIGLISNGQLIANQLSRQPEAKHETPTGWIVHYVVGIAYAYVLFILVQLEVFELTITHGLVFGVVSVLVPWLSFASNGECQNYGSKTPNPKMACALTLMMHSLFGLSLVMGFSTLLA